MASNPDRYRDEDAVLVDADAHAASEDEWPVADLYRADPHAGETPSAADRTLPIARSDPPPPRQRRSREAIAAILLVSGAGVGAIVLALLHLGTRDDGRQTKGLQA